MDYSMKNSPRGKVKKSVSYGNCSVFVLGMDLNCPMCGVLVKSGLAHECEKKKSVK